MLALGLTLLLAAQPQGTPPTTTAAPRGPAARGLDVFLFGATTGPSGGVLPLELVVLGFPTVTKPAPLPGAEVEATWDPASVGADLPSIRARTDGNGRALLSIPIPAGEPQTLTLLLRAQGGGRERTQTLSITRTRERRVRLHVAENRVVPGSVISAWIVAESARDDTPLPHAAVEVELLEGGQTRWRQRTTTSVSGTASVRIPIPRTREVAWRWTLRATLLDGARADARSETALSVREETPAKPALWALFDGATVAPGARATARVRALDATGRPIGHAPLRYWMGSQGTQPKNDRAWLESSTPTTTPASGELVLGKATPTTISPTGSELIIEVRAEVDGHALAARHAIAIGRLDPSLELIPEASALVPGLPQRMLLRVLDGDRAGIRGRFEIAGDGLATTVQTDAHGEAPITWSLPAGAGASHPNGSCAQSVAVTVVIRPLGPAIAQLGRPRFERCLVIDREARHLLVAERPVVRAGDAVTLRVLGGQGRTFTALALDEGTPLALVTIDDGARGGRLTIPESVHGVVQIAAAAADPRGAAHLASTAILVLPRTIPKVVAKVIGGRAVPGGTVEIEAQLTDERGRPLAGTIAGTVHDLHGGGATIRDLDAREQLTRGLDLGAGADQRLGEFFDGDAARDPWRRAALGGHAQAPLPPIADPASDAEKRFEEAFAQVIKSLEGALLEATQDPDKLADVRRKTARGFELNPEMLTLVTSAMDTPPETPGGEPVVLDDLMNLDPQVRFDRVARRIARLKLFWVLEAVRSFVYEHRLLPDELALEAPDAILRRLVREGTIEPSALLDPWGGSIGFVRSEGPRVPYLSVIRGFELRAAGPDGRLGTGDDVRDPFERVLTSGSPYARAVDEDRLVDARYEVVVGDETVAAWRSMFETLTGTVLGGQAGQAMGMGGLGTRGTGSGYGSGASGATARGTAGYATVTSRWIPPVRTDAQGRVILRVPLGDIETTWRITVIGSADGGLQATTLVDVPALLPLSARVEAGAVWSAGDEVEVEVRVRSRAAEAVRASLTITAEGALARSSAADVEVSVPPDGVATARVRVRASQAGSGVIEVRTRAGSVEADRVRHTIEVRPAGTEDLRWSSAWITDDARVILPELGPGESPHGLVTVTLSRGVASVAAAALRALDPDTISSGTANVDAYEAAQRIKRWMIGRLERDEGLVLRADDVARRALGRAIQYRTMGHASGDAGERRLVMWSGTAVSGLEGVAAGACPDATRIAPAEILELEPLPTGEVVTACWENAVSSAVQTIIAQARTDDLARAIIALADRPHRSGLAENLAQRLDERGEGVLPEHEVEARASRALAAAARLRWPRGKPDPREAEAWSALLRAQDPAGGFGHSTATRVVIAALLSRAQGPTTTATVTVDAGDPLHFELLVGPEASTRVTLPRTVSSASVETVGGPVLARLAAPVLRDWGTPPPPLPGPTRVELTWPDNARAGRVATLRCSARHTLTTAAEIEVRIPLPPGVTLAEGRAGLVQSQGVLVVRIPYSPSAVPAWIDIPLRFGLAGRMMAPEAEARVLGLEGSRMLTRAARLEVSF